MDGEHTTDPDRMARERARDASKKHLALLHHHHDARMFTPPNWAKPFIPQPVQTPSPEFKELWFGVPEDVEPRIPLISEILAVVARHYKMTVLDISSQRRTKDLVLPRHVGMYLARTLTGKSYPYISQRFGGRDHTVAIFASKKIRALCQSDWIVAHDVAQLEAKLS